MLTLESTYERFPHHLEQYLVNKFKTKQPVLNATYEKQLQPYHDGNQVLVCNCNSFQPTLHLRQHKHFGLALARFPDTAKLHAENCAFYEAGEGIPPNISTPKLLNVLLQETGLLVAFPKRSSDQPFFKRTQSVMQLLAKRSPTLAKNTSITTNDKLKQFFITVTNKKPFNAQLVHGHQSIEGPYVVIRVERDHNGEKEVYAFPVASHTVPLVIHSQFERLAVLNLVKALPSGLRIESGYTSYRLEHAEFRSAFRIAAKGSPRRLLAITGDPNIAKRVADSLSKKDKRISCFVLAYSADCDAELLEAVKDFHSVSATINKAGRNE